MARRCLPSGVAIRFRGGVENKYLELHLTASKYLALQFQ